MNSEPRSYYDVHTFREMAAKALFERNEDMHADSMRSLHDSLRDAEKRADNNYDELERCANRRDELRMELQAAIYIKDVYERLVKTLHNRCDYHVRGSSRKRKAVPDPIAAKAVDAARDKIAEFLANESQRGNSNEASNTEQERRFEKLTQDYMPATGKPNPNPIGRKG